MSMSVRSHLNLSFGSYILFSMPRLWGINTNELALYNSKSPVLKLATFSTKTALINCSIAPNSSTYICGNSGATRSFAYLLQLPTNNTSVSLWPSSYTSLSTQVTLLKCSDIEHSVLESLNESLSLFSLVLSQQIHHRFRLLIWRLQRCLIPKPPS